MVGFPLGPSATAATVAVVGTALSFALLAELTSNGLFTKIAFHAAWMGALAVVVHIVHSAFAPGSKRRQPGCGDDIDPHHHDDDREDDFD